jgi:hypothetical protein
MVSCSGNGFTISDMLGHESVAGWDMDMLLDIISKKSQ